LKSFFFFLAPYLEKVEPDNGPATGGTNIRISGNYLGETIDEIESVTVGGLPCKDIALGGIIELYITCFTSEVQLHNNVLFFFFFSFLYNTISKINNKINKKDHSIRRSYHCSD